jgi:hypothetical protein
MVSYELAVRAVPLERTTLRSRKMLLLNILKKENSGHTLVSRSQVPPFQEDFEQCVEQFELLKLRSENCNPTDLEIFVDRLDFLRQRVSRLEATGKELELRIRLLYDVQRLLGELSDRCGVDISSSTREEQEEIDNILQNLNINDSRNDDYWEDAVDSPPFFLNQERMQSDFARLVQLDLATTRPKPQQVRLPPRPSLNPPVSQPTTTTQPERTASLPLPPPPPSSPTTEQPQTEENNPPPPPSPPLHATQPFNRPPQNQGMLNALHRQNEHMRKQLDTQYELNRQLLRSLRQRREPPSGDTHTYANGSANEAPRMEGHNYSARSVPVWQWNLKFSGEDNVAEFLTQVREYMQSRHVSEQELLESASELFKGNALKWFRQVTVSYNIRSWTDIAQRLMIDFQGQDCDDELLDSIKNRKQLPNESIVIYVAIMEDMFQRLNVWPTEREKIKILRKNVLPYFIHHTSLLTFSTVEEFKSKCKLLEAGKIQAEAANSASTSNNRQTHSTMNMNNERTTNNRNNQPRREIYSDRRPQQQASFAARMQPTQATYMRQNQVPVNSYRQPASYNNNMTSNRQNVTTNQSNNQRDRVTQCWICSQNGHISRECPNRGNVIGAVEGSLQAPQMMFQDPQPERFLEMPMNVPLRNTTAPQVVTTTNLKGDSPQIRQQTQSFVTPTVQIQQPHQQQMPQMAQNLAPTTTTNHAQLFQLPSTCPSQQTRPW